MAEPRDNPPERGEGRTADALRNAIERTLEATAGPAAEGRERAGKLLDEIARRGCEARDELTRRGQVTREEIVRRGQRTGDELTRRGEATRGELLRRLDVLERRLGSIEDLLRRQTRETIDEEDDLDSHPEVER